MNASHSRQASSLAVLLLIGSLAAFVLRLIGETANTLQMERQLQSNTRRSRAVLSSIGLGLLLVRKGLADFTESVLHATLDRLRQRLEWGRFEGRPQNLIPLIEGGCPNGFCRLRSDF